jgi:hypothetical protein
MCDNCSKKDCECSSCFSGVKIPVGPQGPKGDTGATGAQGIQGVQGVQGVNGTNAFKFVKQFSSNFDGGELTISESELTTCAEVPEGCRGAETPTGRDLNIQIWYKINEPPAPLTYWDRVKESNISYIRISNAGNITISLTGGSIDAIFRVVILG